MAHNHKGEMSKMGAIIIFIVTLPLVLAGLIIFGAIYLLTTVLPAPVEMVIYKSSDYYKETKAKYTLGITGNFGYKTYKYVKKNPALSFVRQTEGYYYYKTKDAVLVVPYYASYLCKEGKWYMTLNEGKEDVPVESVRDTFSPLIHEDISGYEIKLLVKEKLFSHDSLEDAKSQGVFVFYKNHRDFEYIFA
ncbi:MAG: hypothetical protein J6B29_05010 [Clostridia bacterium]|nr:hypothetical protein [Clostridia bacterium]